MLTRPAAASAVAGSGAPSMSPLTDLTQKAAETLLEAEPLAVLLFRRPGCPACKAFRETLEGVSGAHPDIAFGAVDTSSETGIARAFEVKSVPTLAVIREQVLLLLHTGVLDRSGLEEVLGKAKTVDMDRIREDIENEAEED